MINGIRLKVCGLTTRADAEFAASQGADYLGFILYPKSPRFISLAAFSALAQPLATPRNVAVTVEPTLVELAQMNAAGFDFFQVHFRADLPASTVASWAETVGVDRLWLVPKLPPALDLPAALLPLAETFLLDTFDADKFGGTGRTGDWGRFARYQQAYPAKTWILSGGLNPENIGEAIRQSDARFIDVNSGIESAPGVKDHAKLDALVHGINARG
jgi:phosphoribosylanthranilate isomerase